MWWLYFIDSDTYLVWFDNHFWKWQQFLAWKAFSDRITFKVKSFQIYPFEKKSSRNVRKFRWLQPKFNYKDLCTYQQNRVTKWNYGSKSEVTLTNMHYAFLLPFYFYFQCHFDTRFSKKKNLGPERRAYQRKLSMSILHTYYPLRSLLKVSWFQNVFWVP